MPLISAADDGISSVCTQYSHLSELRPAICVNVCLCAGNQLVMYNYNVNKLRNIYQHHSIHMHGHGLAVMSMGFRSPYAQQKDRNNPDIVCESSSCASASWNKSRDVYVTQSSKLSSRESFIHGELIWAWKLTM